MSSGSFGPPFAPAYTCWCCARARLGSTLPPGKGLQRMARHGTPWASTSARTRHGAYSLPGRYQRRVAPCPRAPFSSSTPPAISSVRITSHHSRRGNPIPPRRPTRTCRLMTRSQLISAVNGRLSLAASMPRARSARASVGCGGTLHMRA